MTSPPHRYSDAQMPPELDPRPRLAHLWRLTEQTWTCQDEKVIPTVRKVWLYCTCGRINWGPYSDTAEALAAFWGSHRPDPVLGTSAARSTWRLLDGDDPGGRGAAEDAELRTRIGER